MFADITSANVVGYQNNALQEGATMIAPAFVDIGAEEEGVDLTKLVISPTFLIIGKLEKVSDGTCGLSASFGNIAA